MPVSPTSRILVTGANGFVGRALCEALAARGMAFRPCMRAPHMGDEPYFVNAVPVGEIDGATQWPLALQGCHTVIHTAARAHVMRERDADPEALYARVNVEGTLNLASQAAAAGVRRFIFISTAKVLGEGGAAPYSDSSLPAPVGAYALSKRAAELGLEEIVARTGMELVILRPPLVYGPGVRANFLSLLGWIARGRPLPLGRIANRRSMIGLDNLVDAILTCLQHPAAANRCFLVADRETFSTADWARAMGAALGRSARVYSLPARPLRWGGWLMGKSTAVDRLFGSFEIDASGIQHALGWSAPSPATAQLKKTADWFRARGQL